MDQTSRPTLTLPAAIIIAGALIAFAIIWVKKPAPTPVATDQRPSSQSALVPVSTEDHILGNPDAPIKLVEYSDPSCPYCKIFHSTMRQIIEEYGPSGQVAWVYRSFPLDNPDAQGRILHPNAGHEAQAQECAAALGGNDAFWKFTHQLYEITPSDQGKPLDQTELPKIAASIGLDTASFDECLSSGRFADKVEAQYVDGINAGVSGTPFTIVVSSSGTLMPLNGAQPYATVKQMIETLLGDVSNK